MTAKQRDDRGRPEIPSLPAQMLVVMSTPLLKVSVTKLALLLAPIVVCVRERAREGERQTEREGVCCVCGVSLCAEARKNTQAMPRVVGCWKAPKLHVALDWTRVDEWTRPQFKI